MSSTPTPAKQYAHAFEPVPLSEVPEAVIRRLALVPRVRLGMEIIETYVRVRRLIHRLDLNAAVAVLRGTPGAAPAEEPAVVYIRGARLGWAVQRTLRILPTDTRCLSQSLVLTSLLARRGIPSTLVIGVAAEPSFAAHAWVEYAGSPLLPDERDVFEQLTRI